MVQLPIIPNTDPSRAVLDSFRISIAQRLSETLPLTLEKAFTGVDYGKKGEDFTVALPRFGLPGKVEELAAKVTEGVSPVCGRQFLFLNQMFEYSFNRTNGSIPSFSTDPFFISELILRP